MTSSAVYLSKQFRYMDENCGIPTDVLMENAAAALNKALCRERPDADKIFIVCGKGNNGGDGYALACMLLREGKSPCVIALDEPSSRLARAYCDEYLELGGELSEEPASALEGADVIVECLFGISFSGTAKGKYADIIDSINHSGAFVLCADVPAGLCADSDRLPDVYVRADLTCTFTAYKCALVSQPAKTACGRVVVSDIGIPPNMLCTAPPYASTDGKTLLKLLPRREENSHKGTYGTVAALCGNDAMSGAAYLACSAALRTGVGLVKLYSTEKCALSLKSALPECIAFYGDDLPDDISADCNVLLMGCGCGRTWDEQIRQALLKAHVPVVLDADGINATASCIEIYKSVKSPLILTPHPGELARLTDVTVAEINGNRVGYASDFAKKHNVITVLKGNATVVAAPDGRLYINRTGNSGLAKGGSGDVLSGIIASLLAQGLAPFESAALGVYLHGAAADALAAEKGVYAMLPSELAEIAGKIMYFG